MHNADEFQKMTQEQLSAIYDALGSGASRQVRRIFSSLQPAEIAHLLESSPPSERRILWGMLPPDTEGEVLQELSDDIQSDFLCRMETSEVVEITEGMDTDDLADVLQQLPDRLTQEILAAMSSQDRQRVEAVLSFDEETAGGLMNTDIITVRPRLNLDVVLRYLRRHDELPAATDNLIVVNGKGKYVGLLPLSKILTSSASSSVREVMITDIDAIPASMADDEVAKMFEINDWISAPVVDDNGYVLGRITIDDVVDVIREDADHSLMSMAGLDDEEDTFAPAMRTAPRRAIWLGVNLITAIIASSVINIFQDTIDKVVALAVLMPIVASMGGVAGSQTLTLVVRGMALGQIGRSNMGWLLSREVTVGFLNSLLWAAAMGGIAALWFDDITIAIIISSAMIVNLVVAAFAGTMIPIFMRSINVDPALAGTVVLTTITDVTGFFAFLGLATYFYG